MSEAVEARRRRLALLQRWEAWRESSALILSFTSGASTDAGATLRNLYEHFRELDIRPMPALDVVLVGDGLSPAVAARISALLREFARELRAVVVGVLGPGETMIALGCDRVSAHPMASLTTVLDAPVPRAESRPLEQAADRRVGGMEARSDWTRQALRAALNARVSPPSAEHVDALIDHFTRVLRSRDQLISRRELRDMGPAFVEFMTPDLERVAFDVLSEVERAAESGSLALIESRQASHLLKAEGVGGTVLWSRNFDSTVH